MKEKERWVLLPTLQGFYQISQHGQLRKLSKSLRCYGIQIYENDTFELVHPISQPKKVDEELLAIPSQRLTLQNGRPQRWPISVLMFRCFHGIQHISHQEIIHLDGDEKNNKLENLILANASLKNRYLQELKYCGMNSQNLVDGISAKISKYDLHGRLVKVYKNQSQLLMAESLEVKRLNRLLHG